MIPVATFVTSAAWLARFDLGGTMDEENNDLFKVNSSFVPHHHSSQWKRLVLPPCMFAYVAASMWPVALVLQSASVCAQFPWVQQ